MRPAGALEAGRRPRRGPVLRLKRGRERARSHPWIFKGDVADVSAVDPGAAVTVVDASGRFVGRGDYNPRPGLCCRILTRDDEALDAAFLERRLGDAVGRRISGGVPALGRLAWSEADGLPGLVVDRYASVLVVQCRTLGMARRRREIEAALAGARRNLELNGVAERAEIVAANAFDELRRLERAGARFGLVVLDPPPFARSRTQLEAAVRGYKEINLRAMRLLERGGSLLTFSCSHHVSQARFEELCRDAAADAGARLQMVAPLTQASDHPVVLTIPETRYLSGLLLQAM